MKSDFPVFSDFNPKLFHVKRQLGPNFLKCIYPENNLRSHYANNFELIISAKFAVKTQTNSGNTAKKASSILPDSLREPY